MLKMSLAMTIAICSLLLGPAKPRDPLRTNAVIKYSIYYRIISRHAYKSLLSVEY
jgi:hypothetical protein